MINFLYIASLLIGISGIAILDWKYKLAFWLDHKRTAQTLIISVSVFTIWDLLGISFGIFFSGGSKYSLPVYIFPEFPIEEFCFLTLLCYCTLIIYRGISRLWPRI